MEGIDTLVVSAKVTGMLSSGWEISELCRENGLRKRYLHLASISRDEPRWNGELNRSTFLDRRQVNHTARSNNS